MNTILASMLAVLSVTGETQALSLEKEPGSLGRRWSLALAVSTQRLARSLSIEQAGSTQVDTDPIWQPVALWLNTRLWYTGTTITRGRWRGELGLGLGFVAYNATFPLALQHTTWYVFSLARGWSIMGGFRLGLASDLASFELPRAELGIPLGITWWRIEVQWLPTLVVPLHRRSHDIYAGHISSGAALAFTPLHFQVAITFW